MRTGVLGLVTLGLLACGTVLGLNDYKNAPPDAGLGVQVDAQQGGDEDMGPPTDDAGAGEAGQDAGGDVGPGTTADANADGGVVLTDAGVFVVPEGWTLVAFGETTTTPLATCPAGFTTNPTAVVFGTETATTNPCSCGACSVVTPPSCVTGAISSTYDFDDSMTCTLTAGAAALMNANPGGCNTDNPHGRLPMTGDVKWIPPGPSGGSCSSPSPTGQAAAVSFASQGLKCSPDDPATATCNAQGVCSPAVQGPFVACLVKSYDSTNVGCPPGPFGVQHLPVGTGPMLACSACECTVTATCGNETLSYYRDGACQSGPLAMIANGTCDRGGGGGNAYGSYVFSATVSATTCTSSGSKLMGDAGPGLANEQILCCTQ